MLSVYYGSDTYRLRHAIPEKCEEILDGSDEASAERLENILKYPSFFGEHRNMLVRNAATPELVELLKNLKAKSLTDVTVCALQDTNQPYDKKALTALAKLTTQTTLIEPLQGLALATWVRTWCTHEHITIEPDALKELISRTGTDTQRIVQELEKLAAYAQKQPIAMAAVQALVPSRIDRDEWELSNAFASYNKRAAIVALWRRLYEGGSEQMLLGSCAAGIRNLSMIKDLQSRNQSAGAIAKMAGLHPFVVSKTMHGARAVDSNKLHRAHCALACLDRDAKNGRADATDGLFSILLSL